MHSSAIQPTELRLAALFWLAECDAAHKAAEVRRLAQAWSSGEITLDNQAAPSATQPIPGRPQRPELVAPPLVKRRAMNTLEGRAILIHALAHIACHCGRVRFILVKMS